MPFEPSSEPDPTDVAVGARIRLTRKSRGLSQQELAEAVGLSPQQIQKYERGLNRVSASMLVHIAAALDMAVADFFSDNGAAHDLACEVCGVIDNPGMLELLRVYAQLPRLSRPALINFLRLVAKEGLAGPELF